MKNKLTNTQNIFCLFAFLILFSENAFAQNKTKTITINLNKPTNKPCNLSIDSTALFDISADSVQIKVITKIPDVENITDFRLNDIIIKNSKPDKAVGVVMYTVQKKDYKDTKGKSITFKLKLKNSCPDTLIATIKIEKSEQVRNTFVIAEPPPAPKISLIKDCMSCNTFDPGLIYYDFRCKRLYKLKKSGSTFDTVDLAINNYKKIKKNDKIQLKVVNINRYLYDINVEGKNVEYSSEMPALLNQLFIGDSTLLGSLLSRFSTAATAQDSDSKLLINKTDVNTATQTFHDALRLFHNAYNELQEKKLSAFERCTEFYCCGKKTQRESFSVIASRLLEVRLAMSNLQTELRSGEAVKKDRAELQKMLTDLKSLLTDCDTTATNFDAAIKKLTTERDDIKMKFDAEKDEAKKIKLKDELAAKQKELESKTTDRNKKAASCKENKELLNKQIKAKEDDLRLYSDLDQLQNELPSERDLMALTLFLNNMTDLSNSYTTPPIFPTGNRMNLTLKIKKSEKSFVSDMNIMPYDNDSMVLDLFIKRKPFVSFSSGSFIALGSSLQNKVYTWQALPDNTGTVNGSNGYILAEKSYTIPPMGFSALANFENKATPNFGYGFSAGVGLTIEANPRLAYLGGASLFFGDIRQFAITGGFAAMQIDKLTNDLQAVADNRIIHSANTTNISYYKQLKVGAFISFSYTPFKNKNNVK